MLSAREKGGKQFPFAFGLQKDNATSSFRSTPNFCKFFECCFSDSFAIVFNRLLMIDCFQYS